MKDYLNFSEMGCTQLIFYRELQKNSDGLYSVDSGQSYADTIKDKDDCCAEPYHVFTEYKNVVDRNTNRNS